MGLRERGSGDLDRSERAEVRQIEILEKPLIGFYAFY